MLALILEVIIWIVIEMSWYGGATTSFANLFKSLISWFTVAAPFSLLFYTSICLSVQDYPTPVLWLSRKFGEASQAKAQKIILLLSCCMLLSALIVGTTWSMLGFLYIVQLASGDDFIPVWGATQVYGRFPK
jgi:hypothetical protein